MFWILRIGHVPDNIRFRRCIEITCYDYGRSTTQFIHFIQHKAHTFATCHNTHMIQMCIQRQILLTGNLVPQFYPWSYSLTSTVPAFRTGNLRRFTQPEIARIKQCKAFFLIPKRTVFPFFLSIFTPYSNHIIFRQTLFQIFQLIMKHFLRT